MGAYAGPTQWWLTETDVGREFNLQNFLVLYLDAGDSNSYPGSGTTWTDLSGNGNTGTLNNGVGYSSDDGGKLTFDGGDDSVTALNNDGSYSFGTGDYSIEWWVENGDTFGSFFGTTGISLDFRQFARVDTLIFIEGSTTTNIANFTFRDGNWHHHVISRISGVTTYYLDTEVLTSYNSTADIVNPSSVMFLMTYDYQTAGNLAVFKVYKGAGHTASTVEKNFNALRSRFGI